MTGPIVYNVGESGANPANVPIPEGPGIHDSINWIGMDQLAHDLASLSEGTRGSKMNSRIDFVVTGRI